MVKWGGGEARGCFIRAWREVKKAWMVEAEERSKFGMVKNLMEGGCRTRCVQVMRKELRRIMAKLVTIGLEQ